jgi:hypothetical protein
MGGTLPRRAAQVFVIAATMAFAGAAEAAPARVALVHAQTPSPLEQKTLTRLRGELTAAGFEVSETARRAEDAREAAEEEPPVAGVFATISIVPRTADAADIWVADRITGKTVVRRVEARAGSNGDVAAILAVRAVELLQASLLEAIEPPPRAEQAPTPPVPLDVSEWMSRRQETRPSFSLDAGLGLYAAPGGVHPALLPVLGFSYRATNEVSLRLRAAVPAFATVLEVPEGSISVRHEILSLDLVYRPPLVTSTVRPMLIAGAGAYRLEVSGAAAAPYQGRNGAVLAAHVDLGVGAAVQLGRRVAILTDARALLVTPKPIVRAAGREVASTGRPSVLGELTVEVAF